MNIVKSRPPNFADIVKVFPIARKPTVIFAYAPNIYNPAGQVLHPSLLAHESVHIKRQAAVGVTQWWERYLSDKQFRFDEELLAHRAEFKSLECESRTYRQREVALKTVAKKLAAPLYGRMVTTERAMEMIAA